MARADGLAFNDCGYRASTKQALQNQLGIALGWHRLVFGFPGKVKLIRATIARIAVARSTRSIAGQLKRGQAVVCTTASSDHLIDRLSNMDVGTAGLARLNASEERRARSRVVTGSVAVGVCLFVGQATNNLQIGLERL